MTLKEKRKAIGAYCAVADCQKNGCPLFDSEFSDDGICFANHESEADINEMYRILFGDETVAYDAVNRPAHYTDGKIEVIDFIEDKKLGFCLGNAVKYISRAGKKDPTKEVEDLKKAVWYIERRIKEIEESKE